MASDRAVRIIVGGASALALAVGGWLWLGAGEPAEPGERAASIAKPEAALAPNAVLPASKLGAAQPLPDPAADGDAAANAAGTDSSTADPPPTLATVGHAFQLSGRVVDPSGRPLVGAEVRHQPSTATLGAAGIRLPPFRSNEGLPWDELPRTTTDAAGRFAFTVRELPRKDQPGGTTTVGGHSRFTPSVVNVPTLVVLCPGFEAKSHACMTYESGDLDVGDIVLAPGAALAGRVVDEQGSPVADVEIKPSAANDGPSVQREGEWLVVTRALETRSDADGRFVLDSLWPGKLTLSFKHEGFAPLGRAFEFSAERAGTQQDVGDVVLLRGRSITGYVVDSDNRPLAGARVLARKAGIFASHLGMNGDTVPWELEINVISGDSLEVEGSTDAQGAFRIETLTQASYDLLVQAGGYEPGKRERVLPGATDVTIVLTTQATALLTVVDATSKTRVPGVTATGQRYRSADRGRDTGATPVSVLAEESAVKAAGAIGTAGATEPTGLLLALGLGRLRNSVRVSAPGYASTGFELPGVVAPERLVQTLELPREATVAGRVVDADGAAVADALVIVTPASPLDLPHDPQAKSDEQGRFRIAALPAGEWGLWATRTGFVRTASCPIVLVAGQDASVEDLVLLRGGSLTGRVLGTDGAPAVGVLVGAVLVDDAATSDAAPHKVDQTPRLTHQIFTGADGRFALDALPAGRYSVTASPGAEADADVLMGAATDVVLQLRARPRVHGRVTDSSEPVAEADVFADFAMVLGFMEDGETKTSSRGEYALEFERPGTYRVRATEGGATTAPRTAALQWGDDVLLDLAFAGEGLAGVVVAADTKAPLADVKVVLLNLALDAAANPDADLTSRTELETDAAGRFEARRLSPGPHRVEASRSEYATASVGPVDVPQVAGAAPLQIELQPGAGVSGVVKVATGGAIPNDVLVRILAEDVVGADGAPAEVSFNVDADGNYRWRRLAAGTYLVQVRRRTSAMGAPLVWQALGERRVTLAAGQSETLDFVVNL